MIIIISSSSVSSVITKERISMEMNKINTKSVNGTR